MGRQKQHHFVPEWYLREFSDNDGFLHVFDKQSGLWRRQRPRKIMRRNGYYSQEWVPEGIDPNILENRFGQYYAHGGSSQLSAELLAHGETGHQRAAQK